MLKESRAVENLQELVITARFVHKDITDLKIEADGKEWPLEHIPSGMALVITTDDRKGGFVGFHFGWAHQLSAALRHLAEQLRGQP